MTVYFDVDKIERDLRAALAEKRLPDEPQPHMLVKVRQEEVTIALYRALFTELNYGTNKTAIARALVGHMVEIVEALGSGLPPM